MINKKTSITLAVLVLVLTLTLTLVSAEISYCCEKTTSGAWCQNAQQNKCDTTEGLRTNPTSCEATSYCRLGTCVDSQEGTCMENTPQQVCETSNGVWEEGTSEDIPRCQLGCCLIGDQAAFVTQTRCKRLSAIYSLTIDFRSDMQDELTCISSATSGVMGACVYEKEFTKTCSFISQKECDEIKTETLNVSFHEGFLCSAETLGTDCAPTEKTTCVEGEDIVRFVDSCGNLANVYDASKIKNKVYWSKVIDERESCGYGDSNANNAKCGNCDYFLGSTCKAFKKSEDKVRPNYGDNICRDLACEDENGEKYEHGETWCADAKGIGNNLPGSRYFRMMCYNGDIQVEPCADFRQEICIQDEVNGFRAGACRVNMWQDCYAQEDMEDCLNSDRRDCKWQPGVILGTPGEGSTAGSDLRGGQTAFPAPGTAPQTSSFPTPEATPAVNPMTGAVVAPMTGNFLAGILGDDAGKGVTDAKKRLEEFGSCVPKNAPGFDFWQEGAAAQICPMATQECIVTYKKGIGRKKECDENCWCLDPAIRATFVVGCNTLGDCGIKTNYLGVMGGGDTEVAEKEDEDEE